MCLSIALKLRVRLRALLIINRLQYVFAKSQLHQYVKQTKLLLIFHVLLIYRFCRMCLLTREMAESDFDMQSLCNF